MARADDGGARTRTAARDLTREPVVPDVTLAALPNDPPLSLGYVCRSPAMLTVWRLARRVAESDATVLLTGESGSGKEVVAEYIHRQGARAKGPLIKVNCAALPRELVESELFGATRGAYTGSYENRIGLLMQAEHGTLLLDEITEMPLEAQAKLLRVLQDRCYRPLASRHEVRVNCRFIASTNRDLAEAIREHKLRLDLYYRLSVLTIHVPPLRERREDIAPLVHRFLARFSKLIGQPIKGVTPAALARLERAEWPGNVRQLENEIHRAVLLGEGNCIDVPDLSDGLAESDIVVRPAKLATLERDAILEALQACRGNKVAAAGLLGVARQTLYNKIRDYGLEEGTQCWRPPGGAASVSERGSLHWTGPT